MALGPLWEAAGTWYRLECDSGALWAVGFALGTKGSAGAFLRGLRMGLAFPNSGCVVVGGFSCGSSEPFCGVAVGEFECILALMLASGCRWVGDAAPVEVSADLRSCTMACCNVVVDVSAVSRHACAVP